MNITAEILRDCAYGLPCEEDSEVALLDDVEMARTGSPFICDHLDRMVEGAEEQLYVAREFLHELGMGWARWQPAPRGSDFDSLFVVRDDQARGCFAVTEVKLGKKMAPDVLAA